MQQKLKKRKKRELFKSSAELHEKGYKRPRLSSPQIRHALSPPVQGSPPLPDPLPPSPSHLLLSPTPTTSTAMFVAPHVELHTSDIPKWLMVHLEVVQRLAVRGDLWTGLLGTWIGLERTRGFVQQVSPVHSSFNICFILMYHYCEGWKAANNAPPTNSGCVV
jgi:hypothetical protein